jgi:hypothetical protein
MIIVLVYFKDRSSRMPIYVWDELYFFKGSYLILRNTIRTNRKPKDKFCQTHLSLHVFQRVSRQGKQTIPYLLMTTLEITTFRFYFFYDDNVPRNQVFRTHLMKNTNFINLKKLTNI